MNDHLPKFAGKVNNWRISSTKDPLLLQGQMNVNVFGYTPFEFNGVGKDAEEK